MIAWEWSFWKGDNFDWSGGADLGSFDSDEDLNGDTENTENKKKLKKLIRDFSHFWMIKM